MPILTLQQAKAALNLAADDTSNDPKLQGFIDGITGAVENYLHQTVDAREVVDEVELYGRPTFRLWSAPVISLTSIASLDGATTYDVSPTAIHVSRAGLVRVLSGPAPVGFVAVTYQAGMSPVPANIVQGALVILQHTWETQRGQGTVGTGVIGAEETYDPRLSYSIPRKALEWLGQPSPVVA